MPIRKFYLFQTVRKCSMDYLIMCIGNRHGGDDAIGPYVADRLKEKINDFVVLDCGTVPENFTSVVKRHKPRNLIIIDAVEMGLTPGERFAQLNVATTATGGYAEAAKRRIEGRAEFSGIPDLVQREQQKTIDVAATSAISAASRKITGESEAIKRQAEGKLLETAQRTSELEYRSAMARYGAGEQERQARLGAAGEFFGALPGLADQITNMSDKKEFEGMFSGTKDDPNADLSESQRSRLFTIISGSKNPDAMLKQLLQFGIVL